jgi:adenylate kinase family enzyme
VETTPTRWWIVGTSGSGKSTYARALAGALGLEHHELDGIFHQPHWTPLAPDEFRRRVGEVTAGERWVIDGNYRAVRPLLLARAQVIVALDLPRPVVLAQVLRRSLRRSLSREELWNGNRERLGNLVRLDPSRSIVRYAWITHRPMRRRLDWLERLADGHAITFVRVRSHREARERLAELAGRSPASFLG